MKLKDLVSTAGEQEDAARGLLHTERTDAVNSGIVDSVGRNTQLPGRVGTSTSTGGKRTVRSLAGSKRQSALKGARAGLAREAESKTLEGSELEGADSLYHQVNGAIGAGGKIARKGAGAAKKGAGGIARRLSRGRASKAERKRVLSLSGRKGRKATGGTSQSARYFKKKVYSNPSLTASSAGTPSRRSSKGIAKAAASATRSKALPAGIGGSAGLLMTFFVIGLLLMLAIIGAAGNYNNNDASSSADLNEVESQVAAYLLSQGLDELHAAAIMGNMYAESSMDPSCEEVGGGGIGICQWSGGRASNLRTYAASLGKSWTDLSVQLDFFWYEDIWQSEWSSTYTITQCNVDGDPPVGTKVSGSKTGFLETDDLETAVKEFCYGWERPGIPRIDVRINAANKYYTALTSSSYVGGADYASAEDWQKAIVQAAYSVASPGPYYCARWVSLVYQAAGYSYIGGHACCMYVNYCDLSDTSQLEVGMLVAVQQTTSSNNISNYGHLGYGHVGIYIGDGYVISNKGSIVTETLESFASNAYTGCTVKWGWPW